MKAEAKRCPHCDAKMVEYKHSLSKNLLRGFARIVYSVEPALRFQFKDCEFLSYSQASNMQKLRYWGMIQKEADEAGKGGDWLITPLAIKFLKGELSLPVAVWSYRAAWVRDEGATKTVDQITDGWKYRPKYAAEAVAHV